MYRPIIRMTRISEIGTALLWTYMLLNIFHGF
jgi:hypothetical protein